MRCLSANAYGRSGFHRPVHTADILMVAKALSDCRKGEVLVIDGQGELNTALWANLGNACCLRRSSPESSSMAPCATLPPYAAARSLYLRELLFPTPAVPNTSAN